MDPSPPAPPSREEWLHSRLPTVRRVARALACEAHEADRLAAAAIERADPPCDDDRLFALLLDCWRERALRRRAEPAHEVDRAMHALPVGQREAVALVLVAGLGYAQAAAILAIPVDTLADRLAGARETLAGTLAA